MKRMDVLIHASFTVRCGIQWGNPIVDARPFLPLCLRSN